MATRARLFERALRSPSSFVALVAPAGFGKTYFARELTTAVDGPLVELDFAAAADDVSTRLRETSSGLAKDGTALFDSVEAIRDQPALLGQLAEILRSRGTRRVVLAARPPFPLLNTRAFPPGSYIRFGPEELRFSAADVSDASPDITQADAERILEVTGGWPFGVMLLLERAAGGDLDGALGALAAGALLDVSEYLYQEVIAPLPVELRTALLAVQAVGSSGAAALARAIDRNDASNLLAMLAAIVPLTGSGRDAFALPLLLGGVVESRFAEEMERMRVAVAETLARDRPIEAARHYLSVQRDDAAAAILEEALETNDPSASTQIARLIEQLSPEAIQRSPRLWRSIAGLRRHTVLPHELFAEVRRLRESLPPGADALLVRGLDAYLAFFAIEAGQLDYARNVLLAHANMNHVIPSGDDEAILLAAQGRLHAARYQAQQAQSYFDRALQYIENPGIGASILTSLAALRRVAGDRDGELAALGRALTLARQTESSSVLEVLLHAVFGAWFSGDEIEYQRALSNFNAQLLADPSAELFAPFSEALRKVSIDSLAGKLTPQWQAYTALMVAGELRDRRMIEAALQTAYLEAQRASDVFAELLALLAQAIALPARREELRSRLSTLCLQIPEPAVRESLESFFAGGDGTPILARFVRRYGWVDNDAAPRPASSALRVNVLTGMVSRGEQIVKLSNRPLALVLTLATLGSVSRERLSETLWPDADEVSAANTLKMCVRRARQQIDDPSAIVYERNLWSLRDDIVVDIIEIERNLRAMPPAGILSATNRAYLESIFEFLAKVQPPEIYKSEGMEGIGLRVDAVRHQIVARLGENALAQNDLPEALNYAEVLRRWDSTDEASYMLSIRAYALSGNNAEAYREYRQYCAHCERELGVKPELSLEDLLRAPAAR